MEDNKILKLVYTFFLGLLLAIFVGVGIATFYPGPTAPKYPTELNTYGKELTAQEVQVQRAFDKRNEQYQEAMKPYNRNVSIITLIAAVIFLAISLLIEQNMKVIADGVMFGGHFTLIYSIGRGFASENSKYVFVVVSVSLVIVLYLGYHRFVRERASLAGKKTPATP
ncbi:MAG: hypothetical protein ACXWLH_06275 [Candidatus Saccharimonadales bacterium]